MMFARMTRKDPPKGDDGDEDDTDDDDDDDDEDDDEPLPRRLSQRRFTFFFHALQTVP